MSAFSYKLVESGTGTVYAEAALTQGLNQEFGMKKYKNALLISSLVLCIIAIIVCFGIILFRTQNILNHVDEGKTQVKEVRCNYDRDITSQVNTKDILNYFTTQKCKRTLFSYIKKYPPNGKKLEIYIIDGGIPVHIVLYSKDICYWYKSDSEPTYEILNSEQVYNDMVKLIK